MCRGRCSRWPGTDLARTLWRRCIHQFAGPHRAELVVGVVVAVDRRGRRCAGCGRLLSFAVLVYHATRQCVGCDVGPQGDSALGLTGCVLLAVLLPVTSVLVGAGVVLIRRWPTGCDCCGRPSTAVGKVSEDAILADLVDQALRPRAASRKILLDPGHREHDSAACQFGAATGRARRAR